MNHRVLELLKAPKNIQSEDLNLLKEEINSFPYVQNIRALYLYGVHLYDKENYQKVLSATAAYTTDKKILYQLINGKILPKTEVKAKPDYAENPLKKLYQSKVTNLPDQTDGDVVEDVETEKVDLLTRENSEAKSEVILPVPRPEIKHIYVNGERNRILFEGEENFLEDDQAETIDLESTLESGSIVTQKVEKTQELIVNDDDIQSEETFDEAENNESVPEIEEFIPEIVIGEENIASDREEVLNDNSQEAFKEVESISEVEHDEIKAGQEPEEIIKSEEKTEFTPEIIVEEENINSEPKKEEILDESESSFEEIQPIISEVQNNDDIEVNKVEETISIATEDSNEIFETAEFTPEKIINEDEILSETEAKSVNNESELSFHGTESFLPDVKIQVNNSEEIKEGTSESNINKHEDEMRRLIEEVEKKMKEKTVSTENKKEEKEPENIGNDISFAETQSFNFIPVETKDEEEKIEAVEIKESENDVQNIVDEKSEQIVEEPIQTNASWKPMSFESNLPDSMIDKSPIQPKPEIEIHKEEINIEDSQKSEESLPEENEESELTETISDKIDDVETVTESEEISIDEEKEEAPVMNVSFFGSDISKLKAVDSQKEKEQIKKDKTEIPVQKKNPNPVDSNIPGFINTWQSWLKIDRTEEVVEDKTEIKNKVIETFIENNPKISQLKDESSYIVKEKNDDISHLMTETLASLYFEQKLYTKAIKAFEILIRKNPEKKEYYEGKIQEIKDFRSK